VITFWAIAVGGLLHNRAVTAAAAWLVGSCLGVLFPIGRNFRHSRKS
jgi:hypothetical protein